MAAQPVPHPSTDRRRVKVYELRNNDWFDRGTGFCTATFGSCEDGQPRDSQVVVESEDQPERILLKTRICKEDGFHKQQETLIVWTEPTNGIDMALSFQEAEGCAMIWKFINSIQQQYNPSNNQDDSLSDDLTMEVTVHPISLPEASLANLPDVESQIRMLSSSVNGRDALTKYVVAENYIDKLIPIVSDAEDLESLADLHRLCNIMKTILMLNDTFLIEHAVSDACVLGVVGALEYDPDFPSHKANHRQWLQGEGRFREVVRIEEPGILQKIHQTYRLQYLKDVVLARILDDNTFSVLNSLIFFNQVDIVQHLQANSSFLSELFNIFKAAQDTRKREAVLFIQQCCAIAKNLQPPARTTLYNNFIAHGLFQVVNFGLRSNDVSVRVGATEIMGCMIDHDAQMIRHTIYRQINEKQPPLTDTLIDLLLVETDLGVKSQISETLKILLEPGHQIPAEAFAKANGDYAGRARIVLQEPDPQQDHFLGLFYEKSAIKLFQPLIALQDRTTMEFSIVEASAFSYLVEILCFFIRQHHHRSKFFVLTHNIVPRITQLLQCSEKFLKLVAVRFLRQLVGSQDEFYIKHLCEKKVLEPVLDLLIETMPRDNLISSACLELFELVKKENIKDLVKHMVENYRGKVHCLSYMELFRTLILRYDQTSGFTANMECFMESEDESSRERQRNNRLPPQRNTMEHLTMDDAQEEYWNTSDDEDDLQIKPSNPSLSANGESPGAKLLVDYASDEDPDDNIDAGAFSGDEDMPEEKDQTTNGGSPGVVAPPERVSEKRRREEEEEDDLSKMVQSKRRNSSSAGSTASSTASSALRRKRVGSGARDSGGGPRKIAISLTSTAKVGDFESEE
ncbi:DUF625-domain-containing protein [Astrocystis sublimbata]|nr:DUF625-domain-containing protein [Astrocystis sublimbata]